MTTCADEARSSRMSVNRSCKSDRLREAESICFSSRIGWLSQGFEPRRESGAFSAARGGSSDPVSPRPFQIESRGFGYPVRPRCSTFKCLEVAHIGQMSLPQMSRSGRYSTAACLMYCSPGAARRYGADQTCTPPSRAPYIRLRHGDVEERRDRSSFPICRRRQGDLLESRVGAPRR